MNQDPASIALVAAGALFLIYVLVKSRFSLVPASPEARDAKARIADAKRRARNKGLDSARRAEAWREAAEAALDGLDRPNLAAAYARRAERADPEDPAAVGMLAIALRRASRHRALERFLWRRLASQEDGPGYERAFDELIALYEGPMRRRERAKVLRRLRERP